MVAETSSSVRRLSKDRSSRRVLPLVSQLACVERRSPIVLKPDTRMENTQGTMYAFSLAANIVLVRDGPFPERVVFIRSPVPSPLSLLNSDLLAVILDSNLRQRYMLNTSYTRHYLTPSS